MSAAAFNPDARTPQELCGNLNFLAPEAGRWVELVDSMPDDVGVMDAAQAVASALAQQANLLEIRLRRVALGMAAKTVLQKVTEGTKVLADGHEAEVAG